MKEEEIKSGLDSCLSTKDELNSPKWKEGYKDKWPVQRVYALE